MAKMFYSIEETAEKLGVSVEQVKEMAESGKLQQFRDRDKVMFKRDQVEAMAGGGEPAQDSGSLNLRDTSGETDAIDLDAAIEDDHNQPRKPDKSATGISVFDADEVDAADPMAQTVVSGTAAGDEDLALESVGSGSGLLDLTRESDDTSLGAELLEEIYPAGSGSDAKVQGGAGSGFEGMFDAAGGAESAPSALADVEAAPVGGELQQVAMVAAEPHDPAGSGWTGGLLVGACVALLLGAFIVVTTINGVMAELTTQMAGNLPMYAGGLAVVTIVLAVLGLFLGKALGK
jgi:excisionase family DNA binding protein